MSRSNRTRHASFIIVALLPARRAYPVAPSLRDVMRTLARPVVPIRTPVGRNVSRASSNRASNTTLKASSTNNDSELTAPKLTKRQLARWALTACTAPLWIDVGKDLGFFTGSDAEYPELIVPGAGEAVAEFAAGCFWSVEKTFRALPGVTSTQTGYIGGFVDRPRYFDVAGGRTGHVESVRVVYDKSNTSYEDLLRAYWRSVDATRDDGQFVDSGEQYRPVIWAMDAAQRDTAERSRDALMHANVYGKPIKVSITDASDKTFWPAEFYHQEYFISHKNKYDFYSSLSGRDEYIASVWGDERSAARRKI